MQTVTVLTNRLHEALKRLNKLARKAERYGNAEITVKAVRTFDCKQEMQRWDGSFQKVTVSMTDLEVSGEAPTVGDFEFLARITIGPEGNIVDTVPGFEGINTKFRTTEGHCEHCKKQRARKEVYAVRNRVTGEQIQVGRTCLRDFMGIDDPKRIAGMFSFYAEVRNGGDTDWTKPLWFEPLESLLELANVAVRLFGWCSKGQVAINDSLTPTLYYVNLALRPSREILAHERATYTKIHEALGAEDRDAAKACVKWVREVMDTTSDYCHNLKVAMLEDVLIDHKRIGLVISATSAHTRQIARDAERNAPKTGGWLGKIDARVRGVPVTFESSRVIGTSDWGDSVLVKFKDDAGNRLSWFTSQGCGLMAGERATLDLTVKKHVEWNGAKETRINRVKIGKPK